MPDATFGCPDLTTFCRLDELGLVVVGQRLEPDRAVLACRVLEADDGTEGWCRRCRCAGRPRDTVTRELAHEPLGWRTTTLAEGRRVLINDPGRLNGVKVIGVDEHVWRHTRRGDKYVTVIIDLTPVRAGTGPRDCWT